jgi:2-polyprenyl-6-methoxyphenol hydroxylase-like FAD-dependent oxidoreductase
MACHPTVLSFISSERLWTPSSPYADVPPVQDVPDPEDPANWRFQFVTCWLGKQDDSLDDAGRLAQVKQKASVLCEPYRSAVVWMPDDTKITYDKIAYWVPVTWDNHDGRVTLAGDAAHPMTPRMLVLQVTNT